MGATISWRASLPLSLELDLQCIPSGWPHLRRGNFLLGTQVGGKGCTWEGAGHAIDAMQVRLSEAAYVWLYSGYGFWDSSGSHQSVRKQRRAYVTACDQGSA